MYQIGDIVHYALDGVCEITDIVDKKIGGAQRRFYELHPVYRPSSVVFIPIDNEQLLSRMRYVLNRDEILSAISEIGQAECIWIEQESARRETYQFILKSGDHNQLVCLIKTLYERRETMKERGKKMRSADTACLKDAEKLLHEEFGYVLGIDPADVPEFIQSEIARQV